MPQNKPTSLVQPLTEEQKKRHLLADYVEMFAVIGGRPATPELQAIYFRALGHYELRRMEKGLESYLRRGTNFPWPGTLAEYIEDEI